MSRPATTPALVEAAAGRWPDAEAVVAGETRITFAGLAALVDRAARGAVAAGLRPGDRAAIWAPNGWEWAVALLGLQAAGVVVVPVNTRYKGDEAAWVLDRSGARVLVTVRSFLGVDYPGLLEGHRTRVERTVVIGEDSWQEWMQGGPGGRPVVAEDDPSDVIFTSGTTGRPKGVVCNHGQTVRVTREWASIVGLRAGDRYAVVSPFFHTMGYKAGLVACTDAGATALPVAVLDPPALMALIGAEAVSVMPGPPTLFQTILHHPDRARYDLSSLRLSAVGAASVPVELVRRMREELFATVVTGYGLTETTGVVTMSRPADPPERISTTVGRALPGVEVEVASDGPGRPGEILVRGYNVMQGYLDDPEQTAAAIDADGWLHTGDVGVLDADGYLSITDRLKDMFIVGGFNAYPAEIEAALLRRPDLAMAAVVGVPEPRLGEVGVAFVVPADGARPDPAEITAWARAEMANYKVPRQVHVVDALPLNATGKVMKGPLRDRARTLTADGARWDDESGRSLSWTREETA